MLTQTKANLLLLNYTAVTLPVMACEFEKVKATTGGWLDARNADRCQPIR